MVLTGGRASSRSESELALTEFCHIATESHTECDFNHSRISTPSSSHSTSHAHLIQWLMDFETRQNNQFRVINEQISRLQAEITDLYSSLSESSPTPNDLDGSQLEELSTESVIARGVLAGWGDSLA